MSNSNPRRPSSRGSTPRPRKLAGQDRSAVPGADPSAPAAARPTTSRGTSGSDPASERAGAGTTTAGATATVTRPQAREEKTRGRRELTSLLDSARATRTLIVVLAVLALVLAAQGLWFFLHDRNAPDQAADADRGAISVPEGRPILAESSAAQAAADQAAKALVDIVSRRFSAYDEDVAKATETMTEPFAAEYRETTDEIKDEFVTNRTTVQSRVVAQGVVRADTTRAEVLVFLNQYVTKGPRKDQRTSYTPYRAVVTMASTDQGWLVDGLDTQ